MVSRWDAPHDSGLRDRALFDPGDRVRRRFGVDNDTLVLVRPDGHVAAIVPFDPVAGVDRPPSCTPGSPAAAARDPV